MKKVFDQTVRDLKREVNKKVLKVPGIEQKVLDATSNEPWGPHGSLLADIAQATRNYHEYQMIMAVIWKRINDTGKNWRHVYKALTVLEYLVANGSERVIDEIREHAYQISTLSDFQYIDSGGRDQGNNVRKKSQSLVLLVNDKERIAEVRQKAAANRDKFRNTSTGGMYRPGSGVYDRYDDDRYGSREEDRIGYGYGREREWGSRDDDRYGRDYEERSSRDGYRDDDYRGRSRSVDDNRYDSRSRSSDRDRDRNYDDDGHHSSRGSSAKAEDPSLEARLERKLSEQNVGAPPSYEEAARGSRSPEESERDRETSAASAPGGSSPPPVSNNPSQTSDPKSSSPTPVSENPTQVTAAASSATSANQQAEAFDEFDPRGPVSAAPAPSNNVEMDLLGSLSESFSSNALALVPAASVSEGDVNGNSGSAAGFPVAPSAPNQSFDDPFGDSPFKAIPSTETAPSQPQMYQNVEQPQSSGLSAETVSDFGFGDSFSAVTYNASGAANTQSFPTNSQFPSQDLSAPQKETDILADILPPAPLPVITSQQNPAPAAQTSPPSFSASNGQAASHSFSIPTGQFGQQGFSPATSQPVQQPFSVPTSQLAHQAFLSPTGQSVQPFSAPTGPPAQQPFSSHTGQPAQSTGNIYGGFHSQAGPQNGYNGQINSGSFLPQGTTVPNPSHMASQTPTGYVAQSANYLPQQGGSTAHTTSPMAPQSPVDHASQFNSGSFVGQQGPAIPFSSPITQQPLGAPGGKQNNDMLGGLLGQAGSVSSSTGSNAIVPHQPSKDKFETKSAVWADTLSRGLVNLNISGPKINPLADIGIDFDAINRKEKRMEKPTTTATVTSTVTMGKAMGSGSGIGRAGASALRPPANTMMGSGMGMGMGMGMGNGPGVGMGMGGGYGGLNPSMGMGMGMGGMGMGMNMGMGQGIPMQQPPTGFPPGSNIPGNYNATMGAGNYTQQPYGGSYR